MSELSLNQLELPSHPTPDNFLSEDQLLALEDYEILLRTYVASKPGPVRDAVERKILEEFRTILGFTKEDIRRHALLLELDENTDEEEESSEPIRLAELVTLQSTVSDWLVPELIIQGGGLYLVAAAPKTGKSRVFLYDLAFSVAIEGNFLGMPCKKGKVLVFPCEESKAKVSRTFRSRGLSIHSPNIEEWIAEDLIRIVKSFNLATDIKSLKSLIREYRPSLVVMDSFRAISSGIQASENSVDILKYAYILHKVFMYLGVPCVLIHHMSKNAKDRGLEGVAGSFGLTGANDGNILLYRDPEAKSHSIYLATAPREGLPVKWKIDVTRNADRTWKYEKTETLSIPAEQDRLEKRILEILGGTPEEPITLQDLAYVLKISHEDPIYVNSIDRLVDSLQIQERETSPDVFSVWISANSPWVNYKIEGISGLTIKLASVTTQAELTSVTSDWSPELKSKVWSNLTYDEKVRIIKIQNPPKIYPGDKVMYKNNRYTVDTSTFDPVTKLWSYTLCNLKTEENILEQDLQKITEYENDTDF